MSSDHQETPRDGGARPRVGRPPRLTAAEVVDAAIDLADREGLEALSMPKLARQLGIGTMTVYGYVKNKEDLLDQIARRIFEGLSFTEVDGWQRGMTLFFSEFREAALTHPTLAGLLATGRVAIPAVFDILETALKGATEYDIPIEEAVQLFYTGLTYTIGFVLWEIPRTHLQPEAQYIDQWAELMSQLDPTEYPLVTGPGAAVLPSVASTHQFQSGLDRIIAGQSPT